MLVKDNEDFMKRVTGEGTLSKGLDVSANKVYGVDGSFVLLMTGTMVESTANRLKKLLIKYTVSDDTAKDFYLGVPQESGQPRLIKLGSVNLNMRFVKELQSIFSHQEREVSYHIYNKGSFTDFDQDALIPTIKFSEYTKQELVL